MSYDPIVAELREAWEALRAWGEARTVGQRLVELDALHAARALADRIAAQAVEHPPRVTPDDWARVRTALVDEAEHIGTALAEIRERHGLDKPHVDYKPHGPSGLRQASGIPRCLQTNGAARCVYADGHRGEHMAFEQDGGAPVNWTTVCPKCEGRGKAWPDDVENGMFVPTCDACHGTGRAGER